MSTLEQLPAAVDSLAAIVSSLPAQLATAQLNLTALSSMLEELSSSLGSITPALGAQQVSYIPSLSSFSRHTIPIVPKFRHLGPSPLPEIDRGPYLFSQAQALYSNTTFVSQNIEALGVLTGQIYPDDLKSMDHDSLVELIRCAKLSHTIILGTLDVLLTCNLLVYFYRFAATRYSITDVSYDTFASPLVCG